jgi:septal ring factor EnvC (AmiA/AmiB activator)
MRVFKTSAALIAFVVLFPVLGRAQANGTGNVLQQNVLDELRAMRSSLASLEKGQKALLAILTIQINESRVSLLEEQRKRLATEEQDLDKQIRQTNDDLRNIDGGGLNIVTAAVPGQEAAIRASVRDRQDQAIRRVDEVRRSLQVMDQQIAALRSQISALERQVTEAMK